MTSDPCYHCPLAGCADCEFQTLPQPIEGQTDIYEQLEESRE